MSTPLSVLNKNPGNIRPGSPWEGLAGENGGFCVFKSAVWGFRAMMKNYITKHDVLGTNTVQDLIMQWSPPADNKTAADPTGMGSTQNYIARVCHMTGFAPTQVIDLKSWPVASAVCYAQTVIESGESFEKNWTLAQMSEGAFRAGIVDAPPPLATKVGSTIASSGAGVAAAAAVVQTGVETASQTAHSPFITGFLVAAAAVLAFVAAVLRAKTKTEG